MNERDAFDSIGMGYYYIGNMEKAKLFHTLVKEGYDKSNIINYQLYETIKIDISIELRRKDGDDLMQLLLIKQITAVRFHQHHLANDISFKSIGEKINWDCLLLRVLIIILSKSNWII